MKIKMYQLLVLLLTILCIRHHVVNCDAADVNYLGRAPNNFISSPLSTSQRTLTAIKVSPNGDVYSTKILKQQLANELNLPLRDLRVVDPSLPNYIQATFTARPKAILFCLENIKVVVQHHEALIFNPSQPEVEQFIPILQQNIYQNLEIMDKNKRMRFEHVVLESALSVVCNELSYKVYMLQPTIENTLSGLKAESRGLDVVQRQVDELLPLKNKIDDLRKRVKEIKRAMTEVLNSDEDMSMMFLTTNELSPSNPYISPSSTTATTTTTAKTAASTTTTATTAAVSYTGDSSYNDITDKNHPIDNNDTIQGEKDNTYAMNTNSNYDIYKSIMNDRKNKYNNENTNNSPPISNVDPNPRNVNPNMLNSAPTSIKTDRLYPSRRRFQSVYRRGYYRAINPPTTPTTTTITNSNNHPNGSSSNINANISNNRLSCSSKSMKSDDANSNSNSISDNVTSNGTKRNIVNSSGSNNNNNSGDSSSPDLDKQNSKVPNSGGGNMNKNVIYYDTIEGDVEENVTQQVYVNILLIETLFETYLNEIEWTTANLEEISDEISNTEENMVLQLDIVRNRILRFELNLSILSFVATCGAWVSGLFGMNLLNHMETNKYAFYIVSIITVFGCTSIFFALKAFAERNKLI